MENPADTWIYFIAGYVVILGTLTFYILSLAVRWDNLRKEIKKLPDLNPSDSEIN
jgi:hypothetical protein